MPVFPDGISGSLTHTEGFRAALVGHSHRWRSLGIDAEPARNLPDGVLQAIANRHERRRLRNLSANHGVQCADTVLFSAKEATYKAWFPLTQRFLDFDQADIDLRADGTFTSYLLVRPVPVPFIQGRWLVKTVWLSRSQPSVADLILPCGSFSSSHAGATKTLAARLPFS